MTNPLQKLLRSPLAIAPRQFFRAISFGIVALLFGLHLPVSAGTPQEDAGKRVFARCSSCHSLESGRNLSGPSLHGVVGRTPGAVKKFSYSPAMAKVGGKWTEARLSAFLEKPQLVVRGNRMAFAGLSSAADRSAIIAYLKAASGTSAK